MMASNNDIWVYGDLRNERLFEQGLKVLGKARELAGPVSGKTVMVLFFAESGGCLSMEAAGEKAVLCGADHVYMVTGQAFAQVRPDTHAMAVASLVRERSPMLMLFALTDLGREVAARAARLLGAGLIADCVDLRLAAETSQVIATCSAWGGEVLAEITFASEGPGLATVRPHGLAAVEVRGEPGLVERTLMDDLEVPAGLRLLSSAAAEEERHRLEEAEVVVAGGAGLGNARGFGLVRELAAAMSGEVGATRPAVLQHWASEERLIGQTGKTIKPRLLLSAGISGAVQFTAGIMEAETIVAVNRDPDAPVFELADLGIVADAKTFLPVLIEKVKRVRMRELADMLCQSGPGAEGFGAKARELRLAQGWSIEDLAQAAGQSPEFITKLEADEASPSVAFLLRLAKALGVDPATFLSGQEQAALRDQRADAFTRRTQNYSYQTLTPGAEHEHLRAFMITIEPKQAHKPLAYKHEGEEFVFVMDGELELTLGGKVHCLKPGESLHFNSEIPHKLKSLSDHETRCLVMLYTP